MKYVENIEISIIILIENIENDLDQVLSDIQQEALQDIEQFDENSNLNDGSNDEMEIDDFAKSKIDIEKFNKTLFPKEIENKNEFCQVILYAIRRYKKYLLSRRI